MNRLPLKPGLRTMVCVHSVMIGYNNYPNEVKLDEPPLQKTKMLIEELNKFTDVRLKTIRESCLERK